MNVIPHDREVTRVDIDYHGLTYNFWVHDGHVIAMIGCHVLRMRPNEIDRMIEVLTNLAAQARR